jgi:curved DNA-binding protein CbpA
MGVDDDDRQTLPPEDLETDPEDAILEWSQTLDSIDYLTLFHLPHAEPTDDQVRAAWRGFALAFHPDRHRDAPEDVRSAATRVFQRGAEAYRILLDPTLRRRYMEMLARGSLRMSQEDVADSHRGGSKRAQDLVRSAVARPFAERADELIARGDLKQARLQLQLATMREPNNQQLAERLRELDEKIRK